MQTKDSPIHIPLAYIIALEQLSTKLGKPVNQLMTNALDALFKAHLNAVIPIQQSLEAQSLHESVTNKLHPAQLNIIPVGAAFGILLEQGGGHWIEKAQYPTLPKAIQRIEQLSTLSTINLDNWQLRQGAYPLVILQKQGGMPHIWLGQNTSCKILNNKEVKTNGFKLSTEFPQQNVCKVCVSKYIEMASPRLQLSFDSKKRLLPFSLNSLEPLF